MTQSMIRRTLKNLVQNFSEAEVKVREATSNDPWGPSSTQMSDISDLTYNVVACNEIMGMLWKRLNDDKNWRHVYKSLTLLEYLLKTGSDRIPKQSQENIHIVKPLTEYHFVDKDGKDQGVNVREKAKIVLALIQDEEKRKEERTFAMKTKDKLATASLESCNKEKAEIPPYVGLPSLDNIPSVADLTASMAKKKEQQQRELEEKRKEEERLAKMGNTEPDLWDQAVTAASTSTSDPWGASSNAQNDTGHAKSDPWVTPLDDSKGSDLACHDPWGESVDQKNDLAFASSDPWGSEGTTEKQFISAKNDPWGETNSTEDKGPATNDPWGTSNDLAADSKPDTWDPLLHPKEASEAFSRPWKVQSDPPVVISDPWAGNNGTSEVSCNDPFGDGNKSNNDPWSASASSPLPTNDPWGTPAVPPDAAVTADPFGDGGSSDNWRPPAESNIATTEPTEGSKKPDSFL